MASSSEIERTCPEWEMMERWRALPAALMEGLESMIADGGQCCAKTEGASLEQRIGEGYEPVKTDGALAGHCYLPKHEEEDRDQYKFRRFHLTVLDPDFSDAVGDLVGSLLPRAVEFDLEALSEAEHEEVEDFLGRKDGQSGNVDGHGRNAAAYFATIGEESAALAISHTFVDASISADGKLRPSWKNYTPGQVPYWETVFDARTGQKVYGVVDIEERDGDTVKRWVFTRGNPLIPRSEVTRPVDGVGGAGLERYASFRLYEKTKGRNDYEDITPDAPANVLYPPNNLDDEAEADFVEIPLYPWYTGFLEPYVARPRLRHLAHLCRLKLTQGSMYEALNFYTSVMREIFKGITWSDLQKANEGKMAAGGGSAICLPDPTQDYSIEETSGHPVKAVKESLERLQERINRAKGDTMLRSASPRELVGVTVLREARRLTRLAADAAWWSQAIGLILRRSGHYLGEAGVTIPHVMPSPDEFRLQREAADAPKTITDLMADSKLSSQTGLSMLVDLGRLPRLPDWSPEDEAERIAAELGSGL